MRYLRKRRFNIAAAVVVSAIAGSSVYAFTNSNTMPATAPDAGEGVASISGYTVSSVSYQLDTDPTKIKEVDFTIAPTSAGTVKIQLQTAGTWYACVNTAGSVVCDTTVGSEATVNGADNLTVVATA